MSRDWRTYLDDIITACEKITRFTAGMDREAFLADDRTFHAVIHCLLIVGEATKHIPEDVRRLMPGVEWRKVAGMRDFLAHVYFDINDKVVWDTIRTKVPELLLTVEAFQQEDRADP